MRPGISDFEDPRARWEDGQLRSGKGRALQARSSGLARQTDTSLELYITFTVISELFILKVM